MVFEDGATFSNALNRIWRDLSVPVFGCTDRPITWLRSPRPETTLLYQLVEQHYPAFRQLRAVAGRPLPDYVEGEFDAYLRCGRLEEGFLRLRCEQCHAEKLVAGPETSTWTECAQSGSA
jgi:hypothetical protein